MAFSCLPFLLPTHSVDCAVHLFCVIQGHFWTEICTDCDNSAQSQPITLPAFSYVSVSDNGLDQNTKCRAGSEQSSLTQSANHSKHYDRFPNSRSLRLIEKNNYLPPTMF